MRLISGQYGKARFYDRSPLVGVISYIESDVGIHAKTLRDSYVVPVGKRIKLDVLDSDILRTSASPLEAEVTTQFEVICVGCSELTIHQSTLFSKLKGASVSHEHNLDLFLSEGDQIKLWTTDPSTGGTNSYASILTYQLFDN